MTVDNKDSKKNYKELKNRCWVKDGKLYTIIKRNCRKCMGKRYIIRTFIEKDRVKEITLSCSCITEEKLKQRNVKKEIK